LAQARSVTVRTAVLTGVVGSSDEVLTALDGHLVVYGGTGANSCAQVQINAATLRPSATSAFDCNEWPPGHHTYVVQEQIPRSTSNDVVLRLRHVGATSARTTIGPVVMTAANASNTHYETVYGDGSLWVYACDTPQGAELLRVSDASGKVQSKIAMPSICEAVIAAGDGGFWIAPSPPSGWRGPGVYHVAPGASAPRLVERTDDAAAWIVVAGGDAWIDQFSPPSTACKCQQGELVRFNGNSTTPVFRVPDRGLFADDESANPAAVGNAATGIWSAIEVGAASPTATGAREEIIRIDPTTGSWRGVARLTPTNADPAYAVGLDEGQGVILDGALYFLEPAFYNGDTEVLVRVTPAS
jgi:hypothetical protein